VTGDSEYLLTVDFICHGVSNPLYFSKYIKGLGEKKNSPVTAYSFRNKTDTPGKRSYRLISLKYENGESELTDKDLYVMSYKYRMFYRSSCYNCEFARMERCSDITLGDFWGLEKKIPALQSERLKGISMVMLNTDKARSFKDKLSKFFKAERFNGDFTAYAHLFRPSAPCGIRMKEYSDEMSFIDYLSDTITPKMRMMYTHPKAAWLIKRL
ncbi:MAG: Coenzyme F420 hydrogenase/dehydrogenase, beta subunit C-terminal domain, partial [Ruminococcus sp.]|nr:Coenzyme F420 hydrogenase/dehydrogenase, beta subunit C-terminal domain [Ruminococcus sp.]